MMNLPDPDDEDSQDLLDEEIQRAEITSSRNAFMDSLNGFLSSVEGAVVGYELRRRNPHLYCRLRVGTDVKAVFRVNWLKKVL